MLKIEHLDKFCLYNKSHEKCRYLAEDENDKKKYYCLKKTDKAPQIDYEVAGFLIDCSKNKIDPKSKNVPLGDNCDGLYF
jgi:hypothetical protein